MSEQQTPTGGNERRAFPRRALNLRGELDMGGAQRASVRFVDFCESGLFVQLAGEEGEFLVLDGRQVVADMRLWVNFDIDSGDGRRSHRVPVRVARILDGGIGVAFDPPDIGAIVALQKRVEIVAQSSDSLDPASALILDGVHERLSGWLKSTLSAAFKASTDELFVLARDAGNNALQSEFMDALKNLQRVTGKASRDCRLAVLRGLERLSSAQSRSKTSGSDEETAPDSGGLTLVDTGSFDDWVAAKNIMTRAEPRLRDAIYELSRRFSVLSGREVDDFSNPAGIQQIGMAFNESLQNLGLNKQARKSVYKSFDEIIVASLDRLYESLNGYLVEQGVLPKVERTAPKTARPPRRDAPSQAATERDAWPETDPGTGTATGTAPDAGPPPAHGAGGAAPAWAAYHAAAAAPGPAPGADTATTGPLLDALTQTLVSDQAPAAAPAFYHPAAQRPPAPPVPMAQAYQAARNLMGLRRAMSSGAFPSTVSPARSSDETLIAQPPSAQLQRALNAAQRSDEFNHSQGTQPLRLKQRLMSTFAHEGVELTSAQQEAMDVLSTLVEALVGDPMITAAVKPRIKRLAVPMLKVAMKDQDFFSDDEHPARQVVNRLGMLDLPETLAPGIAGDCLSTSVDPLLDCIVDDEGTASRQFSQALPELEGLLQRQNQRFEERIAALIGSAEHAQALAAAPSMAASAPSQLAPWLARAGHLRPGDVLSFGPPGEPGQSRTLAWVSDDHSLFVFTDRDGSNGSSMNRADLAQHMASAQARLVDAPEVAPMDRGVFSMLEKMHGELYQERERDSVTGLMSLAQFRVRVDQAIERAQKVGEKHALLAMQVDELATITQRGGRKAGDSLLRKLARLFGGQVDGDGALTRVEGDQFLMLLCNHSFLDAKRFAERQCRAVANARVSFKGMQIPITLSVGLVPVTRASTDGGVVMDNARAALATARVKGNQVRVFDPDQDRLPDAKAGETGSGTRAGGGTVDLEDTEALAPPSPDGAGTGEPEPGAVETAAGSDIVELLESGALVLTRQLVQPLSGDDDRPHYEILLGMADGEDGLRSLPGNLIRDAERDNRMAEVDRWVIRNALAWMQRNRREIVRSGGYAINLSGNTLSDESLLGYVMGELTQSAVPPAKVIFEVTESVAIDRLSNAVEFIRTMREYGCRFSIDDFGAGHATFTYLKTLPVDFVKIDGLFVRDMATEPNDQAMVKSIHEISHLLGKKTVAEHVESDRALALLKDMGIDYAQGYAVARPQRLP